MKRITDKERLDWVGRKARDGALSYLVDDGDACVDLCHWYDGKVRQAIDAAIRAKEAGR